MRASAMLYCAIFARNSSRAAAMSASGLASSMPLMNRLTKPRTRRPMRANIQNLPTFRAKKLGAKSIRLENRTEGAGSELLLAASAAGDEAPQLGEARLDLLGRQVAEPRRQEALIRALLDRHEIHVFELAGVRARPHVLQHAGQDVPESR